MNFYNSNYNSVLDHCKPTCYTKFIKMILYFIRESDNIYFTISKYTSLFIFTPPRAHTNRSSFSLANNERWHNYWLKCAMFCVSTTTGVTVEEENRSHFWVIRVWYSARRHISFWAHDFMHSQKKERWSSNFKDLHHLWPTNDGNNALQKDWYKRQLIW